MVEISKFIMLGGKQKKLPMHLALSTGPVKAWSDEKKKDLQESIKKHFDAIDDAIDYQIKNQLRVLTINISDTTPEMVAATREYFVKLITDERISKNQVRVFVIGQWYELDPDFSESLKVVMDGTKIYDNLFLNFCINYDGREEVLGSLKLMHRKLIAGKIKEDDLSENAVKENLYSSYFPPPELIIETSITYSGLLLWDAKGAIIYYSSRKWPLFDKRELDEAVDFYDRLISKDE